MTDWPRAWQSTQNCEWTPIKLDLPDPCVKTLRVLHSKLKYEIRCRSNLAIEKIGDWKQLDILVQNQSF